jgi:hypothetical protein
MQFLGRTLSGVRQIKRTTAEGLGAKRYRGASMKVFISHQRADSVVAAEIAGRLKSVHQIDSYLDVVDSVILRNADDLADHLRVEMGKCTNLIAVVSPATTTSWWVPWEIGMATEKDHPLATFARVPSELPSYLKKWPYLTSMPDVDAYARQSKSANVRRFVMESHGAETASLRTSTREFYQALRKELGQL